MADKPEQVNMAEVYARVTGSVSVTHTTEHRDPATGEIVVDSVQTYTRPERVVLTPSQVEAATKRLGYIAHDVRYALEDLPVNLDNVDRFLASVVRDATSLRAHLAYLNGKA
jgi:hypothetical protein